MLRCWVQRLHWITELWWGSAKAQIRKVRWIHLVPGKKTCCQYMSITRVCFFNAGCISMLLLQRFHCCNKGFRKKNIIGILFHIGRNKCHCPPPSPWSREESCFHGVSFELCGAFGGLTIYAMILQITCNVSRSFHSKILYNILLLLYHQALYPENVYLCPVSKSYHVILSRF